MLRVTNSSDLKPNIVSGCHKMLEIDLVQIEVIRTLFNLSYKPVIK